MSLNTVARKQGQGFQVNKYHLRAVGLDFDHIPAPGARSYATKSSESNGGIRSRHSSSSPKGETTGGVNRSKIDKDTDRDFFLSILGSSATKREARSYLQRFSSPPSGKVHLQSSGNSRKSGQDSRSEKKGYGVNLGSFYGTARAVEDSPRFIQGLENRGDVQAHSEPLHIALVKLRIPQSLGNDTIGGLCRTISQLGRLGMTCLIVVDCGDIPDKSSKGLQDWKILVNGQADRIVSALDSQGDAGARRIDDAIGEGFSSNTRRSSNGFNDQTHVTLRRLLTTPLRRGVIPVIPTFGYNADHLLVPVNAEDIVVALTQEFAGLRTLPKPDEDPQVTASQLKSIRSEITLDRLIILDPIGGIPSLARPNGYHVFLNLEQEFGEVIQELSQYSNPTSEPIHSEPIESTATVSDLGASNPFSTFVETEVGRPAPPSTDKFVASSNKYHVRNLELVRRVLCLLPPTSSALLTTPEEAANSGQQRNISFTAIGVGTRSQKNPLIHNLLTDKPVVSSSLPVGRLGPWATEAERQKHSLPSGVTPTTFAKRGISVTMFPNPRRKPWEPPAQGQTNVALTDSVIDLPRLVHLIEDSFGRKLDVEEYLRRVNDRIAGVIIAGGYEGGALLTWETPPGVADDGSAESRARMVPYLDKFAVLKRSQGSGGVADIVFSSMVRDCFPEGVCWRSRRNNPVNKWYFERSRGTWEIPDTAWTMFWTTPESNMDSQTFHDYEGVCRGVIPSWADKKHIPD